MSLDVSIIVTKPTEVYSANITHNLNKMATACDLYMPLWDPDKIGITKAGQLIEPLKAGIAALKADPDKFKAYNPANGWGDYYALLRFAQDYLAACEANPDGTIEVSR